MKGIVCKEIGKFEWREDLPEPALEEGKALVRIRRIGICGTDLHAYQGNQPYFVYPRVLGHELAGVIEAIGDHEAGLRVGDQVSIIPYMHCGECTACLSGKTNCCENMKVFGVHIDGGMRERVAIPVNHLIKTNDLTLDQSAMLEPLAIGAHALRRARVAAGDTVLVIGAGPIGLGVMALARFAGAKVIAMDVNEERLAFCRSWALVEHTIHALQQPKEQLAQITGSESAPIVIDATGNVASMTGAFDLVAHGGSLIYVGLVKSDITFNDPNFHSHEMTLMGSRNATMDDFDFVLQAISAGYVDIDRYVTHRAAFKEMINHFDYWLKPEAKVIKALVEIND
ncbi:zinc-binding alcohol dehydrogenase family protein [Paenibacillus sp. HN-1]|uniref:zinc-binding alcohol dehydrogenase family protein n=1 Tax=Paenibacillus TaxID=44249 RepID=UPI001CA97FC9|nr:MULTISPECIES: zinc-binding alcohol dehydrogenase family protein [Paenibacillus]MBY9078334.1 zinc-binding alcohol dehydrogenase family protein [Paenibacillus sp. CGMCC 1.18879]MBY9086010.1 zinc-binding alcohol dehydrogenase family protein [Paenibacillus sinensis]